ncbi:MAG: tRNA glutamyl-Q synthetase [Bacteroidia bacterium]|nr:tRNA glutamyl-Q synthetase [Bacteroidia bacterium]
MSTQPAFNKTRLAPTPSGFLHLGNVYSFVLTANLAKQTGAKVLLRIDDLDRERVQKEYVTDIFETLEFMGIPFQEGPRNLEEYENNFSQIKRHRLYEQALNFLAENNLVYACNCSRSQVLGLSKDGAYAGTCRHKNILLNEPGVCWRLKTDTKRLLKLKVFKGIEEQHILPQQMQDFVVRKKDGFAAYQLTSLVDDVHFGIDLIVRGEDLWASTLAQLYLAEVLGLSAFTETVFHHHQLLKSENGLKLSKSAGDTSIQYLRKQQVLPVQIFDMIGKMLQLKGPMKSWEDFEGIK